MAKINDINFSVNVQDFKNHIIDPLVKLGTAEGLVTFCFREDGIYISEKDSKNVMYLILDISSDMLDGYEYNNEEKDQIEVSFNVMVMSQRLTGVALKADFNFDFDKMRISIKSDSYKFIIGMKNRKYKYVNANIKMANKVSLKGIDLFNMINNLSKINQKIMFEIKLLQEEENFSLTLSCSEKDTNDGGTVEIDRFSCITFDIKEKAENYYDVVGTDLLGLADKTLKLTDQVNLYMKTGVPIRLEYSIADDKAKANIYLAPVGASK